MTDLVLYESRGPAAWITLNRPDKLNALSAGLVDELEATIRRAAEDEQVKVIVLQGAGRAFSAGYDLSEEASEHPLNADEWRTVLAGDVEVTMRLWRCPNLDLSAILNAADTPEQREFDEIVRRDGLKAALAWRDSRYGKIAGG